MPDARDGTGDCRLRHSGKVPRGQHGRQTGVLHYPDHSKIYCEKCGNGATLDDYYDFHPFDDKCVIPYTPSAWMALQRINIIQEIRKNPNYSFSTKVEVRDLPKYKPIRKNNVISYHCGEGVMTFDHQGIHFKGDKRGEPFEFDVSYAQYYTLLIENECDVFSFYYKDEYYDFVNEGGEDKYISSDTLCKILENSYFGIGDNGIIKDFVFYDSLNDRVSYSIKSAKEIIDNYATGGRRILNEILVKNFAFDSKYSPIL